jgi:DNA topoisomerase-1
MKRLVVVESPTKARTIRNFLPDGEFQVEASMGHVRDLPSSAKEIPADIKDEDWSRLGVDVEHDFRPVYIVPPKKQKVIRALKRELRDADAFYIATDEDREGESIGWHLLETLEPEVPVHRMVFHEITEEAIQSALENTRGIDEHLVDAQETRRILDRLVGYRLSPLLWRKIKPKLSAGRVQSVAVRLLVMREKERIAFVPSTYWDLKAQLAKNDADFEAQMTHLDGTRVASGRDFDESTGKLREDRDVVLIGEDQARELAERLPSVPWTVVDVNRRKQKRSPYAPFITSTLQQEANRKLNLSARRTMQIAQRLYENGHITYMRTDSTTLSKQAVMASRSVVKSKYGSEYLSKKHRQYKSAKAAQEAHEAIRPAGTQMPTKKDLGLRGIEGALYDLIWKRTVATQMADAEIQYITVHIDAGEEGDVLVRFRASGKKILFPGFFRAYVEGNDDPEAALENRERFLPQMSAGDALDCNEVEPVGHETKPPSRYSEAKLVQTLEEEGIGRPSTYASIIDTITRRGYARKKSRQLIPTFTAFATNNLLEKHFEQLVDLNFTAEMEQVLDEVATGERPSKPYLERFYFGQNGEEGLDHMVDEGLEKIDARRVSTLDFSQWEPFVVRVGKYGPYVEGDIDGERETASLPDDLAPGDVTPEKLREILEESSAGDREMGMHPDEEMPIYLKSGPYGPYVQLGEDDQSGRPKRVSLPEGLKPEDVDFDTALQLINLPRELGEHPTTGKPITAAIGRYGPYVKHGDTFASLKKGDDVLTVGLDRAVELIEEKRAKNKPQRVLGNHPKTGEEIQVWKGRYGPYVKHKKTNASLQDEQSIESITLDEALELLEEKKG